VTRTDRRWLLAVTLVFGVTVGSLLAAREVYRATGPHPRIAAFVRRVQAHANSLLRLRRFKRR
jgi:hypothetical protein